MKPVADLMNDGVGEGVFPGAVLLVSRFDQILCHAAFGTTGDERNAPVTVDTVYDLASLTKPLATAPAMMRLVQEGRISVDHRLASIIEAFEDTDKADIRIRHLLCHNSGLPDYRPYYRDLEAMPQSARRSELRKRLISEPLLHPVAALTLYSDLGFMILDWVIEVICGQPLDAYVETSIYTGLGIEALFFLPKGGGDVDPIRIAPTEMTGAGRWIRGRVHDENAAAIGGVSGHAGLFGTAKAVYAILIDLLKTYTGRPGSGLFAPSVVRQFFSVPNGAQRAMGFDVPSKTDSSAGRYFTPGKTVGHLGFTGTSFWMDLDRGIIIVLLSNRVCPSRDNEQIKAFRPQLHDAVMKELDA